MVHEGSSLVIKTPEFACNEFAVARKKLRGAGGLVLIERFTFRISRRIAGGADVMQLRSV